MSVGGFRIGDNDFCYSLRELTRRPYVGSTIEGILPVALCKRHIVRPHARQSLMCI